ncbi:hypothetical protein HanIR_Chr06g0264741 [Helianthus annuus]|nr:hypothetical protein HanIR_Chr06g0264741 [Helianthus annuus]
MGDVPIPSRSGAAINTIPPPTSPSSPAESRRSRRSKIVGPLLNKKNGRLI